MTDIGRRLLVVFAASLIFGYGFVILGRWLS